jgi:hypothetical protein
MPLKELVGIFPRLIGTKKKITSPCDGNYNCTAWAIEDSVRWWEPYGLILPSPSPPYHWPAGLPQNQSAETFVRFFELNGYERVNDSSVEPGYAKIAIYIQDGQFRHVARQLSATEWTSKIGEQEDITHELRALESDGPFGYGIASIFMRKSAL